MKSFHDYQIESQHDGLTVEAYLKSVLQYSGRKIQKLTRLKGVQLNRKAVFLQKKVKDGDVLRVLILEDKTYGVVPEEGSVDILYEDHQLIILNKPPHILVHPAGQTTRGTLANYLAYYFEQKGVLLTIRPLHRLDRDTSGCVVFAKDAQTQSALEQQIQNGSFKRNYYALIEGEIYPPEGTIDAPIGSHPTKPNRRAVTERGEKAVTHYRTLNSFSHTTTGNSPSITLLELKLQTGRTHQIRVHLSSVGHPIIGDKMYGKSSPLIGRQALHAVLVYFTHPGHKREVQVNAPLPADFRHIIDP